VAAFGGLRWGELVGLRRKRVDLERGTVTVVEQLLEVNGAFSVGPPKSTAGRRTVVLPAVVVEALAEHLARYTAKSPEAFVFLSSQGRHLRRSNFNRRVWQPAVRAAGVEVCACTTCATPPAPWPRVPVARSARSWTVWATRPPWRLSATSTSWLTGTPPSPGSWIG
jgi:integrase